MAKTGINISEALEKVRNSGEFANQKSSEQLDQFTKWWNSFIEYINNTYESFMDWLKSMFPNLNMSETGFNTELFTVVVWFLIIIAVVILLIILYKLLEHYRRTEKQEVTAALNIIRGKLDSSAWLEKASQDARSHDYREACRSVYMAILLYLDEKEIIKYDSAKTNMEYLQTVKSKTNLYDPLKQIINIFEFLWYGKQQGTENQYSECMTLYETVTNE